MIATLFPNNRLDDSVAWRLPTYQNRYGFACLSKQSRTLGFHAALERVPEPLRLFQNHLASLLPFV